MTKRLQGVLIEIAGPCPWASKHINLDLRLMFVLLAAGCCSSSKSEFAVLPLLSFPKGGTPAEQDGVILLFDAE